MHLPFSLTFIYTSFQKTPSLSLDPPRLDARDRRTLWHAIELMLQQRQIRHGYYKRFVSILHDGRTYKHVAWEHISKS